MCGRKVLAWFVLLQKATMKNTMKLADREVRGMHRVRIVSLNYSRGIQNTEIKSEIAVSLRSSQ